MIHVYEVIKAESGIHILIVAYDMEEAMLICKTYNYTMVGLFS